MKIAGMEKLTLLDYPDKMAAIIFTQGCNFKCPFCQNSALIPFNDEGVIAEDEVLNYLEKRRHVLDGIVISGGEPTLQPDLENFIKKVKTNHLSVKLDTNGFQPQVLKHLIDNNLVDYVAMDIKNTFDKYGLTCGIASIDTKNILESINILNNSGIDHEFRTTIIKEHHDLNDIENIIKLTNNNPYYLQNFKNSEGVLVKNLHGFSNEELLEFNKILNKKYVNVHIRGL